MTFAWFLTPIGRRVGIGILAFLILAAIVWKIYGAGQESGKSEQKDVAKTELQASKEADQSRTGAAVAQVDGQVEAAQVEAKAAKARADRLEGAVLALLSERRAAAAATAAITDPELHPANRRLLGETEGQACYSASAERRINTALTQFPLCEKQVEGLGATDKERLAEIAALNRELGALQERERIKDDLAARNEERWRQLWNLNPPKVRSWKCLKAWKCGAKRLSPP